ncbi:MAG: hypothetical protein PHO08_06575 [Methylococcales bacterium]|nr:hypothetical protein [Methylococcales bacterium]
MLVPNLGMVGIIEAAAFLPHDAGLGIGKADLLFVVDSLTWVELLFTSPKAPTVGAPGLFWPL